MLTLNRLAEAGQHCYQRRATPRLRPLHLGPALVRCRAPSARMSFTRRKRCSASHVNPGWFHNVRNECQFAGSISHPFVRPQVHVEKKISATQELTRHTAPTASHFVRRNRGGEEGGVRLSHTPIRTNVVFTARYSVFRGSYNRGKCAYLRRLLTAGINW